MDDIRSTTTLWRPVGPEELALVQASGTFPPRLPDQPIFYPVLTHRYAAEIAEGWNVPAHGSGFVLEFRVKDSLLSRYEPRTVRASHHRELWVPAAELAGFNDAIVGPVKLVRHFERGHDWHTKHVFDGRYARLPDKVECDRCGSAGARFGDEIYRDEDVMDLLIAASDLDKSGLPREQRIMEAYSRIRSFGTCQEESGRS